MFKRWHEKRPLNQNLTTWLIVSWYLSKLPLFILLSPSWFNTRSHPCWIQPADGVQFPTFYLYLSVSFSVSIWVSPIKGRQCVVPRSSGGVWHPLEKEAQAQLWWGPVPLVTQIPQINICKPSGLRVGVRLAASVGVGCIYNAQNAINCFMLLYKMSRLQYYSATVLNCQNTSEHRMIHIIIHF